MHKYANHLPPPPLSPLYDSLTTNLPHPLMSFSGFTFPPSTPLFPKAQVVASYLQDYARAFGLHKYIRFNESVSKVDFESATRRWIIRTIVSPSSSGPADLRYDADLLLICNGHHNVPRYPRIPGIDAWLASNRAAHSMFYRRPDCAPWRLKENHKVLVVGGGPSGQDVVMDAMVEGSVKEIIHSASHFRAGSYEGQGLKRRPRVVKFGDVIRGEVEFEGRVVDEGIDYVILATGYEVQLPFLSEEFVRSGIPFPVPPLPKELWNTSYGLFPLARYLFPFSLCGSSDVDNLPSPTSIFFIGLLVRVVPMPLVEVQASAALAVFAKPDKVDWTREAGDVVRRYQEFKTRLGEKGTHEGYFRFEPMEQFDYRDMLVDLMSAIGGGGRPARRVRMWEREMYDRRSMLRETWQELEASGEAEEWVRHVGEGKAGKTAEEEWVELLWKVVRRAEEG